MSSSSSSQVILAGGCFWCIEGALGVLRGVSAAESGYIGGTGSPTYEAVCGGDTGHAEAVRVVFDETVLPFPKLLRAFFAIHDPTTLNRAGNDVGTQYRSAIFYTSEAQRAAAAQLLAELAPAYSAPIVTELVQGPPAQPWHRAEEYHQRYFEKNPTNGYCRASIPSKIRKLAEKMPEALK